MCVFGQKGPGGPCGESLFLLKVGTAGEWVARGAAFAAREQPWVDHIWWKSLDARPPFEVLVARARIRGWQVLELRARVEAAASAEGGRHESVRRALAREAPCHELEVGLVALHRGGNDVEGPCAALQGEALPVPAPLEGHGRFVGREIHERVPFGLLVVGIVGEVEEVVGALRPPLLDELILRVAPWHIADGKCCRAGAETAQAPLAAARARNGTLGCGWHGRPHHLGLPRRHGAWPKWCAVLARGLERCTLLRRCCCRPVVRGERLL
mmetsp:Transcript_103903/g.289495  ORF Transcript_103903/g.289495 Transcript_103903/m.289495 type:complete len:269 (+) Transcript_103903:106-912(+)